MEIEEITIGQLRRNVTDTFFQNRYLDLVLGNSEKLNTNALSQLLKLAVIFLNYGDPNLKRLGYRIVVRYSILFDDFVPLFDVAINKGFIPISKFIEAKHFKKNPIDEKFFSNYFSSYQENFRQEEIYLTYGQKKLIRFSDDHKSNFVLVAPTSYGKSEIIINKVAENLNKKVCILVPSKALLAQTKKRILGSPYANEVGRIITHPEMYRGNEINFVAVLTQERYLRLLQKNQLLTIDILLVDEAHNLLKRNSRAVLLAQVIMITLKRNANTILNFFSPFISDGKNLKIPHIDYSLEGMHSEEFIKIERYYCCDLLSGGDLLFYDQFLNRFSEYNNERYNSDVQLINEKKAGKNIVYLNKQRDVESFALRLSGNPTSNQNSSIVDKIITTIADFLHPDYNLLKCIQKGVAYHHGGMPELVRLYVESIFTNNPELHFIITNSTLLEGVNIPAEKIFLLTTKIGRNNFSKSEFKNLIGRICRFSEIFNLETGRLNMLEPEVYIIKSEYESSNANHQAFLENKAKIDLKLTDDVDNLLLKGKTELKTAEDIQSVFDTLEYLENIEPNTVVLENAEYVQSDIAKLCYRNNVFDFDIKENERQLIANLDSYSNARQIDTPIELIEAIYNVFIYQIAITDDNFKRLNNSAARNFYAMILDWRTKSNSFKEMIARFIGYWSTLPNPVVFFGSAWGEVQRDGDRIALYINLNSKSQADRVNLAILKIKDEQDFIEFRLLKYVEILFELGLIENTFYEKIKYGSSDPRIISFLKNGFSIELSKLLIDPKYLSFIQINVLTDEVIINEFIIDQMIQNEENSILVFEIRYHIRSSR
ncbi:DEAD/DEAH box helicase [Mucilaginibacter sp.]|uniref:DEAD/DEAH box helicase n=1 Tax=Mucilaginibacter sp. TaxID=1882438 RepID=UPI0025DFFAA2|nr:DEAD/DEAH box helicase [Mucilaginibacter sp.]